MFLLLFANVLLLLCIKVLCWCRKFVLFCASLEVFSAFHLTLGNCLVCVCVCVYLYLYLYFCDCVYCFNLKISYIFHFRRLLNNVYRYALKTFHLIHYHYQFVLEFKIGSFACYLIMTNLIVYTF